jgi:hypothetical protein
MLRLLQGRLELVKILGIARPQLPPECVHAGSFHYEQFKADMREAYSRTAPASGISYRNISISFSKRLAIVLNYLRPSRFDDEARY